METQTQSAPVVARHQVTSIDARDVFFEIVGRRNIELQTMNLVFGTRTVADGRVEQVISGLNDGTIIYPLCERWDPPKDEVVTCLVYLFGGDMKEGRALAINLREELRKGRWKRIRNVIKEVVLRKGDDGDFYGFDNRGKKIIVTKSSSIAITDEEIRAKTPIPLMTAERLRKHDALYRVSAAVVAELKSPEEAVRKNAEKGLVLQAEAVGAILSGADLYMLEYGGNVYDICSELGVPKTASIKEIEKAYRLLSDDFHPDKREQEEMLSYGVEKPTDLPKEIREMINVEFGVINACYVRLSLVRTREISVARFREKGKRAFPEIQMAMAVKDVAGRLFKEPEDVVQRLKNIGFPVRDQNSMLGEDTVHTLLGSFAADVEEEQRQALLNPTKKPEPVVEVAPDSAPEAASSEPVGDADIVEESSVPVIPAPVATEPVSLAVEASRPHARKRTGGAKVSSKKPAKKK